MPHHRPNSNTPLINTRRFIILLIALIIAGISTPILSLLLLPLLNSEASIKHQAKKTKAKSEKSTADPDVGVPFNADTVFGLFLHTHKPESMLPNDHWRKMMAASYLQLLAAGQRSKKPEILELILEGKKYFTAAVGFTDASGHYQATSITIPNESILSLEDKPKIKNCTTFLGLIQTDGHYEVFIGRTSQITELYPLLYTPIKGQCWNDMNALAVRNKKNHFKHDTTIQKIKLWTEAPISCTPSIKPDKLFPQNPPLTLSLPSTSYQPLTWMNVTERLVNEGAFTSSALVLNHTN